MLLFNLVLIKYLRTSNILYAYNSDFYEKEDFDKICDKTNFNKNDVYFQNFEKIKNKNEVSIKILYFMSLLDPDRIQISLIKNLIFDDVSQIDVQKFKESIDLLIQNGLVESFRIQENKYLLSNS